MKKLCSFTVKRKELVEVEEISTNENNDLVKTTKKTEKEILYEFCLQKPTRTMSDEASLFYSVRVAEGIKAGLLTIPLLEKRNLNDGGILSDSDKEKFLKLYEQLYEKEKEFQKIEIKKTEERSDEEKKEHKKLLDDLTTIRIQIQDYEIFRNSLYDNTAEIRARNHTITWWLLHLAHQKTNDKEEPFFGEGDYQTKLKKYDEILEKEDKFLDEVLSKFVTYVTLWATNRASTQEDFEKLEKLLEQKPAQ